MSFAQARQPDSVRPAPPVADQQLLGPCRARQLRGAGRGGAAIEVERGCSPGQAAWIVRAERALSVEHPLQASHRPCTTVLDRKIGRGAGLEHAQGMGALGHAAQG